MTTRLDEARRWFAEDLRVSCNVRSEEVLNAFATVPRERFLGPPPWTVRSSFEPAAYSPAGDDPSLVYHNVPVALDLARDLYNGQPGLIARWFEDLAITPGARVLHVGAGTGYFTAIIGQLVGRSGHVCAVEVDEGLAGRARTNVAEWPWIDVTHGDGVSRLPAAVDVVLIHAGATHVLDAWLDPVVDGGRILVPLTGAMPAMGAHLGKGMMLLATRAGDAWRARVSSMVAIYSLVGARDDAMNAALGQAMMSGALMKTTRLRRDAHERTDTCIVHGSVCLSV
jgi:protein-L-isoaspartate(D-aspartate) O-methyltransferase